MELLLLLLRGIQWLVEYLALVGSAVANSLYFQSHPASVPQLNLWPFILHKNISFTVWYPERE